MGDLLYIGSCSGLYYALDRSTGEVAWSYDTGAEGTAAGFHGDPLITGDLVLTGSDHTLGGQVYAFDLETGEVRWQRDVGGLESDLVPSGETAVGATSRGGLIALGIEDGTIAWVFNRESLRQVDAFSLTPVIDGERIFFGGRDGKVYALSSSTGDLIWERDVGRHVSTPTRLFEGQVYVGTYADELLRLDAATGAVTARLTTERFPHHALVQAGSCLIVLLGERQVACVDQDLEQILWRRETEKEWTTYNPLVLDGLVVVGTASGELFALRPEDGSIAWNIELEGRLRGLGVAHDVLYVGTFGGTIYALEMLP